MALILYVSLFIIWLIGYINAVEAFDNEIDAANNTITSRLAVNVACALWPFALCIAILSVVIKAVFGKKKHVHRNIKEAIKHMELLHEQLASLEQQNEKLKEQLNTSVVLLCSNKASVVKNVELEDGSDHYITSFCLQVEVLDGNQSGTFSPESTPYQAVLTGIEEYVEFMKENRNVKS